MSGTVQQHIHAVAFGALEMTESRPAVKLQMANDVDNGLFSPEAAVENTHFGVVQVMSEIWEADASDYAQWMDEIRVLSRRQQRELSASLREYFMNASKVN